MQVNRKYLLQSLQSISPGMTDQPTILQSNCFLFKDGMIWTFNGELACHIKSPLEDISCAFEGKGFVELLENLTEDRIGVRLTDSEIVVIGNDRMAGFRIQKKASLPVNVIEKPESIQSLPKDLSGPLKIVGACAGQDYSKPLAVTVNFHPEWIEAGDDTQVCRYPIQTGVKNPVPLRWESLKKILPLGIDAVGQTESWLHFSNEDWVASVLKMTGRFPSNEFTKFLEVEGTEVDLPQGLAEACKLALIFSQRKVEKDEGRVTIDMKEGKLRLRAEGDGKWYEEIKALDWHGPPLKFRISPRILLSIIGHHCRVIIGENKLAIRHQDYSYCTSLYLK